MARYNVYFDRIFLDSVEAPSSFEARRRVAAGKTAMRAADCYAIRADLDKRA